MGQCYSVKGKCVTEGDFHQMMNKEFMRIFLGNCMGEWSITPNPETPGMEFSADFKGLYSLETIMTDTFKEYARKGIIREGSYLVIWPDHGVEKLVVKSDGAVDEFYSDVDRAPYADDEDDLDCILQDAEIWNPKTGTFLFGYSEDGDVCKYSLSKEYAKKIAEEAGTDSWSSHLPAGGQIISAEDVADVLGEEVFGSEDFVIADRFTFDPLIGDVGEAA